jgi:hypothetical protein
VSTSADGGALRAHARQKWPAIGWDEIEQLIQ